MGSFVELNDTLRISKAQGFPSNIDIESHLKNPFTLKDVESQILEFSAKEKIRLYQQPPVRNHLVEDLNGKWLYWGLCYILEVTHNYETGYTSGKYKIVRLNSPEEMKAHFKLTHIVNPEQNYFENS